MTDINNARILDSSSDIFFVFDMLFSVSFCWRNKFYFTKYYSFYKVLGYGKISNENSNENVQDMSCE